MLQVAAANESTGISINRYKIMFSWHKIETALKRKHQISSKHITYLSSSRHSQCEKTFLLRVYRRNSPYQRCVLPFVSTIVSLNVYLMIMMMINKLKILISIACLLLGAAIQWNFKDQPAAKWCWYTRYKKIHIWKSYICI